ncbi:MAG TPA: ABC transporter permease [Chloroflexota bacterium]|nr:ABC transporter permease [Chloroflexota bacterium]
MAVITQTPVAEATRGTVPPTRGQGFRPPSSPYDHGLVASLRELWLFREVMEELVKRDLKVRYKRSVLGIFWTMLNPLLMMVITSIVFSNLFRASITNFPIYVLSGYLVWTFFSQSTIAASSSILDSSGLTRKVYVPPALFPIACVVSAVVNLTLTIVPLALLMLVTGGTFSLALLILPVSVLLLAVFSGGLGLILASSAVFFRDAVYTYQVLLVAWMYLTPLFYPETIIPAQWQLVVYLNPVYHLVKLFRAPIYGGVLPDAADFVVATVFSCLVGAFGWWFFEATRRRFVAYL